MGAVRYQVNEMLKGGMNLIENEPLRTSLRSTYRISNFLLHSDDTILWQTGDLARLDDQCPFDSNWYQLRVSMMNALGFVSGALWRSV